MFLHLVVVLKLLLLFLIAARGFAAVSASPVSNVKEASRKKELVKLGLWTDKAEQKYRGRQRNQAIISGTADYAFKHFAKYWKRYSDIINSWNCNDS